MIEQGLCQLTTIKSSLHWPRLTQWQRCARFFAIWYAWTWRPEHPSSRVAPYLSYLLETSYLSKYCNLTQNPCSLECPKHHKLAAHLASVHAEESNCAMSLHGSSTYLFEYQRLPSWRLASSHSYCYRGVRRQTMKRLVLHLLFNTDFKCWWQTFDSWVIASRGHLQLLFYRFEDTPYYSEEERRLIGTFGCAE